MKAFALQGGFGLGSLSLVELPDPRPAPGQVVLRMRAASLNYRDLLTIKGIYNPRLKLPLVPLSDGIGEVVEVGEGVTRVRAGDRVAPIFLQRWIEGPIDVGKAKSSLGGPLPGVLSELVAVDQDGVVAVPEHLTDEEAATLPCAAVTAWNALFVQGGLTAGDTVLLLGTGGVSVMALQLARLAGARAIITSSSDDKLERARALGASDTINYKTTPQWDKRARELSGGVGVDHVVEVGGAGTLPLSLSAVRLGGVVSVIGMLSAAAQEVNVIPILMKQIRVQGILVGSRAMFEAMNRAIALAALRPVIDRVFPFADAPAALAHMESASHFGKIVVRM